MQHIKCVLSTGIGNESIALPFNYHEQKHYYSNVYNNENIFYNQMYCIEPFTHKLVTLAVYIVHS